MKENKSENDLKWTGERYLPWMDIGEIHYEHLHRYYLANSFVNGKTILDLGCGEGYGCFLFSKTAKNVVGVDIDIDTINHAKKK